MFTRLRVQLLLFNLLLTLCCVAANTNQLADRGDEISFLQLAAKATHHASDAAGTKGQLGATVEYSDGRIGSDGRRNTSKPAMSIFCYAIESPVDVTAKQLRRQLQGCDGYLVFAYYSNPEENTVNMFSTEEMTAGKTEAGWADVAKLMPKVLHYIIDSDLPERFTWFVKLDPDSFFRPRFLYPILAKYNAESPLVLGSCEDNPRLRGAMETFSHKVFRQENSPMLLDMNISGGEDDQLSRQIKKLGYEIIVNDKFEDCNTMFFDYANVPHERDAPHEDWDISVIPNVLREFFANPDLTCKELPSVYGGFPNRVHRNVVMAHPIKDVKTYEELQALDSHLSE